MTLRSLQLCSKVSSRDLTERWLRFTRGDILSRKERRASECALRMACKRLRFARPVAGRETRLALVREALYLRELLRRDEEARIEFLADGWVPPEFRRWPDRSPLWVPLVCSACDYTAAAADALDGACDAARRGLFGGPVGEAIPDEAARRWHRAKTAREAADSRWGRCAGQVLWARRRALWEQTPQAQIDLLLEAWALGATLDSKGAA